MSRHVFLATTRTMYEGDEMLGVCSTRELALLDFRARCSDPNDPRHMDCSHDRHFVERWEIDGHCVAEEVFSDVIEEAWSRGPSSVEGGEGA